MEKETIIELKNIRKEFPGVVALDRRKWSWKIDLNEDTVRYLFKLRWIRNLQR